MLENLKEERSGIFSHTNYSPILTKRRQPREMTHKKAQPKLGTTIWEYLVNKHTSTYIIAYLQSYLTLMLNNVIFTNK